MSRYPDRARPRSRRSGRCSAATAGARPEGIRQAAAVMAVTPAYLESVASFYDLLHTEPAGSHRVLVCTNISCWMRGADELLDAFCEAAGCDRDEAGHGGAQLRRTASCFVSGFECLGACDLAPMASIDERYFGPLEHGRRRRGGRAAARRRARCCPRRRCERARLAGGPEAEPDERVAGKTGPTDA